MSHSALGQRENAGQTESAPEAGPGRGGSPGGVSRTCDDLIVVDEAAAGQVT